MNLVSLENNKLKIKNRDQTIFITTIVLICLILVVELVNLCLVYSPFKVSEFSEKARIRMGIWITNGSSSNAFYFSWLNILMICINVGTIGICILCFYLNFFKAYRSYANKYQYLFYLFAVLWLVAITFIGQFSMIHFQPLLWSEVHSSGAFANYKINQYGIALLVISILFYLFQYAFLICWIIFERKKYLYRKLKKEIKNKQKR